MILLDLAPPAASAFGGPVRSLEAGPSPRATTMSRTLAALCIALLAPACTGTRKLVDPTLRIETEAGSELGVSTTYGLVFLGRTATSGYVEIEAMFGDGPDLESSVVEPIGGGLYTAETEIRLPSVRLHFDTPSPGDELLVAGRDGDRSWESTVTVRRDPRVWGLLLDVPRQLDGHEDQVGAGVYWVNPDDEHDRRLVGLVSGTVKVIDADGGSRRYLAVVGPEDLWRLVTHHRDFLRRKPWVYREDVL